MRKKILDAVFYILANVVDQEGIESLLEHVKEESFTRLWHLWLDAGYRSDKKGKGSGRRISWGGVSISSNVHAKLPWSK